MISELLWKYLKGSRVVMAEGYEAALPVSTRFLLTGPTELQVRIAVLNGYTSLGIPVTVAVEQFRPGKGEIRSGPDLRNKAHSEH